MFGIIQMGGSLRELSIFHEFHKGNILVDKNLTKKQAHEKVKKLRGRLNRMDKNYYHIKYKTIEIPPKTF